MNTDKKIDIYFHNSNEGKEWIKEFVIIFAEIAAEKIENVILSDNKKENYFKS